ncbi:MAG: LacI family DNA-binding transcriptional regulator [Pseudomonadota bacterium]
MSKPFETKRANVRDVARHAQVSVATVSRVLNRAPNVADQTRAKVEHAMSALRFVPSSAARAINTGRSRLIGALIPAVDHAIFALFVTSLEERLDTHGLSLIVANTNHDPLRELDRAKKLLNVGVEGLIVSGVTRAEPFDALVDQHQVPVIATSLFQQDCLYPTIGYDNAAVAGRALEHLTALGHRAVGVLHGPAACNDRVRARLSGLREAADVALVIQETHMTFEAAAQTTRKILADHPEVTALLCLSDVLAQGALVYLKTQGLRVPKDLSVIGVDDLPNSGSFDPPLTTVQLPAQRMGERTADALATRLETGERPKAQCLDTALIERASTGPPPRAR